MSDESEGTPAPLPAGEYAIVEVLGHRTIIGRIEEVERFGSKLMGVEPLLRGALLPQVLIGGGSIYQFTPCSAEVALARSPKQDWQLPASVRAAVRSEALPAPVQVFFDEEPAFRPAYLDSADPDEEGEPF